MKLTRLSFVAVAIACLSTSSYAQETLKDAFQEGKFGGELKAYYFNRDAKTSGNDSIFTTGVLLKYETLSYKNFKLGALLQTSSSPFANKDAKAEYNKDMYGSGAQLTNAYIKYKIAKTTATVGRQHIKTPLVRSSGSRLVKQAFEGERILTKIIPKTEINFMHINKFQARTDGAGDIAEFEDVSTDGAYSIMARTKFIPNTIFTAQYLDVKDDSTSKDYQVTYVDGKYLGKADNFSYNISAQHLDSQRTNGKDSDVSAFKVGIKKGNFSSYVAYSKTGDESVKLGLGSSVYGVYYTGSTITAGAGTVNVKDSESYAIDLKYKLAGIKFGARYVQVKENSGENRKVPGIFASYTFKGALKGLSTHIAYEENKFSDSSKRDTNEMRLKLKYTF